MAEAVITQSAEMIEFRVRVRVRGDELNFYMLIIGISVIMFDRGYCELFVTARGSDGHIDRNVRRRIFLDHHGRAQCASLGAKGKCDFDALS